MQILTASHHLHHDHADPCHLSSGLLLLWLLIVSLILYLPPFTINYTQHISQSVPVKHKTMPKTLHGFHLTACDNHSK